jgi:ABC-2 type transport system ATP-binding protein
MANGTHVRVEGVRTLSGGVRRRVGIVQAVVADPQLLLLEEPTTGLDPEQRMRFRQLIAGLGEHCTVVLSTHRVEDVAAICTQVVVLWQGRARFFGTPTELRRLAVGQVWSSPGDGRGAVSSWRTEAGAYRARGPPPSPHAEPLPPTVEDGYLLVCARSREDTAAWRGRWSCPGSCPPCSGQAGPWSARSRGLGVVGAGGATVSP